MFYGIFESVHFINENKMNNNEANKMIKAFENAYKAVSMFLKQVKLDEKIKLWETSDFVNTDNIDEDKINDDGDIDFNTYIEILKEQASNGEFKTPIGWSFNISPANRVDSEVRQKMQEDLWTAFDKFVKDQRCTYIKNGSNDRHLLGGKSSKYPGLYFDYDIKDFVIHIDSED